MVLFSELTQKNQFTEKSRNSNHSCLSAFHTEKQAYPTYCAQRVRHRATENGGGSRHSPYREPFFTNKSQSHS